MHMVCLKQRANLCQSSDLLCNLLIGDGCKIRTFYHITWPKIFWRSHGWIFLSLGTAPLPLWLTLSLEPLAFKHLSHDSSTWKLQVWKSVAVVVMESNYWGSSRLLITQGRGSFHCLWGILIMVMWCQSSQDGDEQVQYLINCRVVNKWQKVPRENHGVIGRLAHFSIACDFVKSRGQWI